MCENKGGIQVMIGAFGGIKFGLGFAAPKLDPVLEPATGS